MTSNLSRVFRVATVIVVCAASRSIVAQEAVLSDLYGRGVHQYFAGNDGEAEAALSAAINGGTRDPRAYYFRALVGMRSGASDVEGDLRKAAELESADSNLLYPVGKALERVQGASRMTIERHRAVARAEAHQRQLRRDAIRYEELRRSGGDVSRPLPPSPSRPPIAAPPVPAPEPAAEDPFADEPPKAVAPPAAQPPDRPAPGDEPPAKPGDDPFAEPPAGDEPEMKADAPAETPEESPFGDEPK